MHLQGVPVVEIQKFITKNSTPIPIQKIILAENKTRPSSIVIAQDQIFRRNTSNNIQAVNKFSASPIKVAVSPPRDRNFSSNIIKANESKTPTLKLSKLSLNLV